MDCSCRFRLECQGLDCSGWVHVNGCDAGTFKGTHVPHTFEVTPHLKEADNVLEIIFDLPPRWLGQFGYTSRITEWKTRFNYTWDWSPRLVQIGLWDAISLVAVTDSELRPIEARILAGERLSRDDGLARSAISEAFWNRESTAIKDLPAPVRAAARVMPGFALLALGAARSRAA